MALYPDASVVGFVRGRAPSPGLWPVTLLSSADMHNRNSQTNWSPVNGGTPVGVGVGALSLPIESGSVSAFVRVATVVQTASVQEGRPITGDTSLAFTVDSADLLLTALLSANGTLTFTVAGANLGAAVGMTGDATFALTPNTPLLGALAGLFGSGAIVTASAGTLTATGALSGDITPYSTLSPENLANAVWSALAVDNNDAGSMGNKLNSAASGGVDLDALAQAVWAYASRTLTSGGVAPTAEEVADAVLAAAQANPIHADARRIKGQTINGSGTQLDPWGP